MKYIFVLLFIVALLSITTTVSEEFIGYCKNDDKVATGEPTRTQECCQPPNVTQSGDFPKFDAVGPKCTKDSNAQVEEFCHCCGGERNCSGSE